MKNVRKRALLHMKYRAGAYAPKGNNYNNESIKMKTEKTKFEKLTESEKNDILKTVERIQKSKQVKSDQTQKSIYLILNIETKEIDLASNLLIVSKLTQIPKDKLYHEFSRKKETFFQYLQYKIYKKIPYSKKNAHTITPKG